MQITSWIRKESKRKVCADSNHYARKHKPYWTSVWINGIKPCIFIVFWTWNTACWNHFTVGASLQREHAGCTEIIIKKKPKKHKTQKQLNHIAICSIYLNPPFSSIQIYTKIFMLYWLAQHLFPVRICKSECSQRLSKKWVWAAISNE